MMVEDRGWRTGEEPKRQMSASEQRAGDRGHGTVRHRFPNWEVTQT
jgi:hypothetical protein